MVLQINKDDEVVLEKKPTKRSRKSKAGNPGEPEITPEEVEEAKANPKAGGDEAATEAADTAAAADAA